MKFNDILISFVVEFTYFQVVNSLAVPIKIFINQSQSNSPRKVIRLYKKILQLSNLKRIMSHGEVKIGINGFGRIGRLFLRNAMIEEWSSVVAINDPCLDAEAMAYLFKYDSLHGTFPGTVDAKGDQLCIDGKCIKICSKSNLNELCWGEHNVDIVVECSGQFTNSQLCQIHLEKGAKRVIISAPTHDNETKHIVLGVNEDSFDPSMNIVSCGSCTTYCVAPLAKLLNDKYGIEEALFSAIHAVTSSQSVVDGPSKKDFRAGRAAMMSIIPATTGAADAVTKVLPELEGKITGMSFRVPVQNVSVIDFTCKLKNPINNIEDLGHELQQCVASPDCKLHGLVDVVFDPVVSSDFNHSNYSCVIDVSSSLMLNPTFIKLVAYYDNEWAYARRLVRNITNNITSNL